MFTDKHFLFIGPKEQEGIVLNANQIRAARALLNWSQTTLVERTGLSLTTIRRMEDDKIGPERSAAGNVATVSKTLVDAGVLFLDDGEEKSGGPGVRIGK